MDFDLCIADGYIVLDIGIIKANLYIKNNIIAKISQFEYKSKSIINAKNKYVIPGLIDGHVHFMDPSEIDREDFITGSSAAAAGGVTTVIEHTHSSPIRNLKEFKSKLSYVSQKSVVDFGLTAHIWGDNIEDLEELWKNGITMFKLFTTTTHGVPGMNNFQIKEFFKKINSFNGLVLCHCEDDSIVNGELEKLRRSEIKGNEILYLWRNKEAEIIAVNTVGLLAKLTGVKAIIAHASHPDVIEIANEWKNKGANLWIESCPQYFYLFENEVIEKGGFRKFTPPTRITSQYEKSMMWKLLNENKITHISSDHAPSTKLHKSKTIMEAPFGLPEVETTLRLMLHAVNEGWISIKKLVEVTSTTPAKIYGLYPKKGAIKEGADADVVVVDLQAEEVIEGDKIYTKAKWSPYEGIKLKGKPLYVISRGEIIYEEGKVLGKPGRGKFLPGPGFANQ